MPLNKFRNKSSAKFHQERTDVIPWPPPSDPSIYPFNYSFPLFPPLTFPPFMPSSSVLMNNSEYPSNNFLGSAMSATSLPHSFAPISSIPNTCSPNPSFVELHGPSASMASTVSLQSQTRTTIPPIGVFWDIENCQVPKGKSALITVQRIRDKFFNRFLEAEFVCVCDIRKESPQVIQELNDAQVSVVHVAGNSKNAADDKLRQAMRRFADVYTSVTHPESPPATILLISGDINFATDLSDLRYRKRLYIVLLHNKHAPEALIVCANEAYDFHSTLGDLPPRPAREDFDDDKEIPLKGGQYPMDVVVSELPLLKNVNKIKTRLKKLSDNCGGKVLSIQGQFAVVRFPNKESALRASKRMNGEDVFGSKIRVLYSSQIEIPQPQLQQQAMMSTQQQPMMALNHGGNSQAINSMHSVSPQNTGSYSGQNKKKPGWKRSATALEQSSTVDYPTLKKEVAALLQDVPNHSLPLFKFREMFERRYRRSVSSYDLYRMRDVVNISESSTFSSSSSGSSSSSSGRNISLNQDWVYKEDDLIMFCKLHPPKNVGLAKARTGWAEKEVNPVMPMVVIELKLLASRVHSMLHSHNGVLPILSFLDCYEFTYGPIEISNDGSGVPLEHLITCVQGVEIGFAENGLKRVQWSEKKELEVNSTGLAQPQALQMAQLSRELVDLLRTFTRCCLPFSKLIPAYHHHFGRQCRVADYGHATLSSLLKTLPGTIQVMGENQNRVLTLAHKAQMKRFATDVLRVLKAQGGPRKQIKLEEFGLAFSQVFPSRNFSPEDYGLCYLHDLVTELVENSNLVALLKDDDGSNLLAIPKREQTPLEIHKTRIFATEVFDLLRHSIRCEMPFSKFIPAYHHHFGRQCRVADYGFSKLAELFEAITDTVIAVNPCNMASSAQDCCMDDKILRLTPKEQLKVVGEQLWSLVEVRQKTGYRTALEDLDELFLNEYGFSLRPDLCEADNIADLVKNRLSHFMKVEDDCLVLVDRAQIEQLVQDTKSILEAQADQTMRLDDFIIAYKNRFQKEIDLQTIQNDLAHLIIVTHDENEKEIISFAPLRVFAKEVKEMLEDIGGYILIANFDTAYLHKYGRPIRPGQMGFTSVSSLLHAIPEVVSIRGTTRSRRTLVLNSRSAPMVDRRPAFKPKPFNSMNHHGANGSTYNGKPNGNHQNHQDPGCQRWSPKWRNNGVNSQVLSPQIFSAPQSPIFASRGGTEGTAFTFDRPPQLSPPVYDMWMRDATAPTSPSVSPPMVWAYHPVVYPAPANSPAPSPNVMMPTHISFGSGPWSPPPTPMMVFEQRMPPNSINIATAGMDANGSGGMYMTGQGRLTNSFQRLKLSSDE